MTAWADHGADGNGEPMALVLRAGNAGSNTAADHIEATRLAIAQLPRQLRRRVLIRADSGGGTHGFLDGLTTKSRRLHYSVGMTITENIADAIGKVPAAAWTPAYDGDGQVREGTWVADITGLLDLDSWPPGMRVIVREERPHPGAQLRLTDIDGHRFTCFATDAKKGQLADLELRHRRRARREEGFAARRTPGCGTFPQGLRAEPAVVRDRGAGLRGIAWTQMLALASSGRWLRLRLAERWPWAGEITAAAACLQALHPADQPEQPDGQEGETPGLVEPRPPGATAGQPGTTAR
jgi:hypothetical protein